MGGGREDRERRDWQLVGERKEWGGGEERVWKRTGERREWGSWGEC